MELIQIYGYLDGNGDGVVTLPEARPALEKLLPSAAKDAELDTDGDGKVSSDEFSRYYDKQYNDWKTQNVPSKKN
ncbi:hypothetical protein DdX_05827 [Ditylenchus destructor]|uniref:EF-hand domain-containing protein n=1 Tax=Ditylenchus destructor TaxID=166010 RepID=A0AAD4RA00_9BILA|nr:hypothetical protein DdX_05827 [Ditylenchus destructor]